MWDCVGECLRLKFENTSHCQVCQLVVGLVPIFQFSCLSVWSWSWKIRFLEWRLHSIVKCVTLVVDFAGVSRYQGISVLLSFCISDFVRLDFKTEDYIPSSSVSASDIRNSPPSLRGIRLYHQGLSVYTYIHHCHLIIVIVFCILIIVIANCHLVNSHLRVGGGGNRAEKHKKWHRSTLFLQLLPQTEKAQLVTPQTTKYRYRRVTFKQWMHWKSKKKSFHSNITFDKFS